MTVSMQTYASLRDAAAALGRERDARFFGGGTLMVRRINEGTARFSTLVRSTDRQLREVRASGSRVLIGAGVTMGEVLARRDLDFLHAAARVIGGPAVRAAATVGGNLFAFSPYGDFTAALLALDATVSVQSGYSPREIALEEFLAARAKDARSIVTGVQVARPRGDGDLRFTKIARVHPRGVGIFSIAAHLPRSGGRLAGVRIAYSAMAPTPTRAKDAERALEGRELDAAAVDAAVAVATAGCTPATDSIATEWYRRQVLPVHLRRLLLGAA